MLEATGFMQVVGIAHNCTAAKHLMAKVSPDVVIADIDCIRDPAIESVRKVVADLRPAKLFVLSESVPKKALELGGATGVIRKTATSEELIAAVARDIPPSTPYPRFPHLSPREQETLELVCDGLTSKEIGSALGLSVRTVEAYKRTLMEKAGARNAVSLARFAFSRGYLRP